MNIEDPDTVNASLELVREFWGLSSGSTSKWQMCKGGATCQSDVTKAFSWQKRKFHTSNCWHSTSAIPKPFRTCKRLFLNSTPNPPYRLSGNTQPLHLSQKQPSFLVSTICHPTQPSNPGAATMPSLHQRVFSSLWISLNHKFTFQTQ